MSTKNVGFTGKVDKIITKYTTYWFECLNFTDFNGSCIQGGATCFTVKFLNFRTQKIMLLSA